MLPTAPPPELDLLRISGGGENGAFGAGLLNGWTERGGRPAFFLVTGISTGALSAPFAFLGSGRDPQLRSVYTDITLTDVLVQRGYAAAIWNDGMADNNLAVIGRDFTVEYDKPFDQAYMRPLYE